MNQEINFDIQVSETEIVLQPRIHQFTLIYLHTLGESPSIVLTHLLKKPLLDQLTNFRVVIPQAPSRYVTPLNKFVNSWFDVLLTEDNSVKTNQNLASQFNSTYQKILVPLLNRQNKIVDYRQKSIFLIGFSQGCALANHILYTQKIQLAGVVGVAGNFLNFTQFQPEIKTQKLLILGAKINKKLLQSTILTYENRYTKNQIILIQDMRQQSGNKKALAQISNFIKNTKESLKKQFQPKL